MNKALCRRIKAVVADTYISYDNITGAQAFEQFIKRGENANINISVYGHKVKAAHIQEEMSDLYKAIMQLCADSL